MIRFDFETWRQRPDLYPMMERDRLLILGTGGPVKHGDILVGRADGTWVAIPEDVFNKIRREYYG